jgi:hypothetical protein
MYVMGIQGVLLSEMREELLVPWAQWQGVQNLLRGQHDMNMCYSNGAEM